MALPRKVGLPITPPPNRGGGNTPESPSETSKRAQNREGDGQPVSRPKTPQSAETRTSDNKRPPVQDSKQINSEENRVRKTSGNKREQIPENFSNKNTSVRQSSRKELPRKEQSQPPVHDKKESIEEGYAIDPKTGIKHRVLPGVKEDAVKSFNSLTKKQIADLTFSSMKHYVETMEDFDIEDLDNTAQDFLGHLRIAPDKEEQKRLREERASRKRSQNEQFAKEQERLNKKYGDFVEPDDIDE